MILTEWFGYRRRRLALADFNRGYDYAAGRLLRGIPPPIIEVYFDEEEPLSDFDKGALEAIAAWERRNNFTTRRN